MDRVETTVVWDDSGKPDVIANDMRQVWSPIRKQSDKSHTGNRKLSESRGVNLPDLKIPQSQATIVSGVTPPSATSPVGGIVRFSPHLGTICGTTNSSSLARGGLLDVCIFLPDQRGVQFTICDGRTATAIALHELISAHLGVNESCALEVFSLWMVSPLLEVQLKPHHVPYQVRQHWHDLLRKFTNANAEELELDEPLLTYKRNVLLSKSREKQVAWSDSHALEILYLCAREAVHSGRCLADLTLCLQLAAIHMCLSWGPYNRDTHTLAYIRQHLREVLPEHWIRAARSSWSLFGWSVLSGLSCRGTETELLDQYRLLSDQPAADLYKRYLELCHKLPFYGAAYFSGQIEPVSHGWLPRGQNVTVRLSVNCEFVTVVDCGKYTCLLCVPLVDCHWQTLKPAAVEDNTDVGIQMPSVFLHFPDPEVETQWRLLQIFTKQAVMVEALMRSCFDLYIASTPPTVDEPGTGDDEDDESASHDPETEILDECQKIACLRNKLDRLCLATFDAEGKIIDAHGSLKEVLQDSTGNNDA